MPADPKNVFEPCSLAHWGPKKPETTQKLGQKKVRLEGNIENKVIHL